MIRFRGNVLRAPTLPLRWGISSVRRSLGALFIGATLSDILNEAVH